MQRTIIFEQRGKTLAAYPVETADDAAYRNAVRQVFDRFERETGIHVLDDVHIWID